MSPEEKKEKYREYQRERYKKNKFQLKIYYSKTKEERQQFYKENKTKLLNRVKECYKTKKQLEKSKDIEIFYLRELINELQEITPNE
jgi:hypothetical protein